MRTDAKKNLKKVATEVLKDPLASRDEIARRTGLSQGNVSDKLTKIDENIDRTSTVVRIADKDLTLVEMAQLKAEEWLQELREVKREDVNTANQVARESQKRYSVLMGKNTDDQGGEERIITNSITFTDGSEE